MKITLTKEQAQIALSWLTDTSLHNGDCAEQCESVLNALSEQIESEHHELSRDLPKNGKEYTTLTLTKETDLLGEETYFVMDGDKCLCSVVSEKEAREIFEIAKGNTKKTEILEQYSHE